MTDQPGLDVGAAADLPVEETLLVPASTTGTVPITIFHDETGFFALNDRCTHGNASLAEGWIEDGTVECPLHGSPFCLATGKALGLPATVAAPTHRVEVVDGRLILYPGVPADGTEA
ncbi:non-heme iron oxygenase ferredoxin subunit [Auritidibacter ignavus]|uniref:non-heme iron oxygenase ferredoxin subunit n=1 Tax=Auritidibacter TaxID=1160973 RepID=UPI000D731BE3|nr:MULTISPECIES: non-heme iron oxygenase ferredoxin subunit [Auritidibacter]PXA81221.1 2Fe-2S ferredoxin [Auritidibacter sp. NML120779]AXR74175.1 non-heme iron oxygenase ferredoxin subunit [Auritidibacter sp. NML130574]PXA75529.1 2Fe-2S ferredoxin [Auritidibacter sp. NML100628]PXA79940.1 2Fe-2S ferredoxin [Auritidibacter sp. NML120636]WGH80652.1 non-heme iron oxygenase ferredoxin subunit [Auritidibacter ignavus]